MDVLPTPDLPKNTTLKLLLEGVGRTLPFQFTSLAVSASLVVYIQVMAYWFVLLMHNHPLFSFTGEGKVPRKSEVAWHNAHNPLICRSGFGICKLCA